MDILHFKTNICAPAAVCKVAPSLDAVLGPGNWQLDLVSADRILTVAVESPAQEESISALVRRNGYYALNLEDYYAIF